MKIRVKNNRGWKIRWERLLAGMLCLCMMLSVLQTDTPVRAEGNPPMQILVYNWHTGSVPNSYDQSQIIYSGTYPVRPVPETSKKEKFTAFSVTAGQSAVSISGDTATVTYDPLVPLVKIHIFYSSDEESVEGLDLGELVSDKSLEVDTQEMSRTQYESEKNRSELMGTAVAADDEKVTVYDTSEGLHTNKTVQETVLVPSDTSPEAGTRSFDVTLESWFAGKNIANVGLILDASGSMAWTADTPNKINIYEDKRISDNLSKLEELLQTSLGNPTFSIKSLPEDGVYLTQEEVDIILDKAKTDNSLLGYSDYSYYVYDGRNTVKEYTPLAYWDGTGANKNTYDTLNVGQIGHYTFDDTSNLLKNTGYEASEGATAQFIGKAETESGFSEEEVTPNTDYKLYDNTKPYKDNYLIVHGDSGKQGITNAGGNVLLDAKLKSDSFTISFAVSSDKNEANKQPLSDILYIGSLGKITENNHYRIYRDGSGSSKRVKWDKNIGSNRNNPILNANGLFKTEKQWYMLTYVVNNGKVTTYIDGEAFKPNETDDPNSVAEALIDSDFFKEGKEQNIIIGGADEYGEASLLIDEVYIYNRPLSSTEVKRLKEKKKILFMRLK